MHQPARQFLDGGPGGGIEAEARAAVASGRRVSGATAAWCLVFQPVAVFCGELVFRGGLFRGYPGWRQSVTVAARRFAVNARIYEIVYSNRGEIEKIKGEYEYPRRD